MNRIAKLLGMLTLFACASQLANAQQVSIESLHSELTEILTGAPRTDVIPTPELCRVRMGKPKQAIKESAESWYVSGTGGCSVTYQPETRGIFTPLAESGNVAHFLFDPAKIARMLQLLDQLALQHSGFDVQLKFDLQLTLWELITALQHRRDIAIEYEPPIDQVAVDKILQASLRVLKQSLLSDKEIAALPDNLTVLAQQSNTPAIAQTVQRIAEHDPRILELVGPTQVHRAFGIGRIFARVFITSDDPTELKKLQAFLKSHQDTISLQGFDWAPHGKEVPPSGIQEQLVRLPQKIGKMRLMLVLYFQILNQRFKPVPTRVVAGWREVWFDKALDSSTDMIGLDPSFNFRLIDYRKQIDPSRRIKGFEPRYELVAETRVARSTFLDVNPAHPGAHVTTQRAACLSCHADRIRVFDYRGMSRNVVFTPPLTRDPVRVEGGALEERLSDRFTQWFQKYVQQEQVR